MKILKILLVLALALALIASMTACGSGDSDDDSKNYDLVVKYYSGAYGDDWIKLAAEEFSEEKGV
ncbi:MAG: hypothetical protein J5852_08550 [Clostridia bacterium]|nr:hypothetical protein [Clostridia bacterium]